ncbi:translation initiation factor IF-2-like [Cricetulus griseus]|uniref:Translation initiation factor IF-2-like n=1 Tax=Cricetulus griseus TaxID=10029 RepID=A0A9J7J8D1_CRIGR|nr:translation initiation factor IF-2-like [Cricetulus griseus]
MWGQGARGWARPRPSDFPERGAPGASPPGVSSPAAPLPVPPPPPQPRGRQPGLEPGPPGEGRKEGAARKVAVSLLCLSQPGGREGGAARTRETRACSPAGSGGPRPAARRAGAMKVRGGGRQGCGGGARRANGPLARAARVSPGSQAQAHCGEHSLRGTRRRDLGLRLFLHKPPLFPEAPGSPGEGRAGEGARRLPKWLLPLLGGVRLGEGRRGRAAQPPPPPPRLALLPGADRCKLRSVGRIPGPARGRGGASAGPRGAPRLAAWPWLASGASVSLAALRCSPGPAGTPAEVLLGGAHGQERPAPPAAAATEELGWRQRPGPGSRSLQAREDSGTGAAGTEPQARGGRSAARAAGGDMAGGRPRAAALCGTLLPGDGRPGHGAGDVTLPADQWERLPRSGRPAPQPWLLHARERAGTRGGGGAAASPVARMSGEAPPLRLYIKRWRGARRRHFALEWSSL